MANILWALVGVAAGSFIAIQAQINAELSRGLGLPVAAAASSFIAGAMVLTLASVFVSQTQDVAIAWRGPATWLFVAGGCLGAAYVTCAILLVPRIGTAATMAFIVTGQLLAGMAVDRIGFLGLAIREVTAGRLIGACLLLGGALMIRLF